MRSHHLRVGAATGPNIVTDGLVFHVDAGNASSYSGSGYQVNSLVGSINNNNGSGFDGTISHTAASGSNPAYFSYPSNVTFGQVFASSDFDIITYPSFSMDCWINIGTGGNATDYGRILGLKRHAYSVGSVGDTNAANTRLTSVWFNSGYYNPAISWTHYYSGGSNSGSGFDTAQVVSPSMGTGGWLQNKWFHFAVVNYRINNSSGARRYYVDGQRITDQYGNQSNYTSFFYSATRNPASPNNTGTFYLYLGGSEGSGGYQSRFHGDYSIYRFYKDKVLSDAEVAQNWNAQKALFGR